MIGITPISEVLVPELITLQFLEERAAQRKIALDCPRCGGTGKFLMVAFEGVGSKHGSHCFSCGDAWKLPLSWKKFTIEDIVRLFEHNKCEESTRKTLQLFVEVRLLTKEKFLEVSESLINKIGTNSNITVERVTSFLRKHGVFLSLSEIIKIQKSVSTMSESQAKSSLKALILYYRKASKVSVR